jgi:hypothetical protein
MLLVANIYFKSINHANICNIVNVESSKIIAQNMYGKCFF